VKLRKIKMKSFLFKPGASNLELAVYVAGGGLIAQGHFLLGLCVIFMGGALAQVLGVLFWEKQ
jgi:hypothetical protein